MKRHNFKNLKIWQEGIDLVQETYGIIKKFPAIEKFNLSSQLVGCAVSIPSNIAEGTSKSTNKHFKNYLETSLGSAFEWETQLIIAQQQEYINEEKFKTLEEKIKKIQRMISSFIDNLS